MCRLGWFSSVVNTCTFQNTSNVKSKFQSQNAVKESVINYVVATETHFQTEAVQNVKLKEPEGTVTHTHTSTKIRIMQYCCSRRLALLVVRYSRNQIE